MVFVRRFKWQKWIYLNF